KRIRVNGITVGGVDARNYTFNWRAANAVKKGSKTSVVSYRAYTKANVTPFTLIVNFTGVSRVYDATTVAAVLESDNHFAHDDITVTPGSAVFDDKNVGTDKRITEIGSASGREKAGNYV